MASGRDGLLSTVVTRTQRGYVVSKLSVGLEIAVHGGRRYQPPLTGFDDVRRFGDVRRSASGSGWT